jgi:hypothetical protein
MLSLFPALLYTLAIASTTAKAVDAGADANADALKPRRQLHGRFLHITDMHPDQHYRVGASVSSSCHRNRPRKEHVHAAYFGTPYRSVPRRQRGAYRPCKNHRDRVLITSPDVGWRAANAIVRGRSPTSRSIIWKKSGHTVSIL